MKFFSQLFKKNQYSNVLDFEDNECTHCHNVPHDKLKKCDDCNTRNICRFCYYDGKILCKSCDEHYEQWANKIKKICNKEEKQSKYGYINDNKAKSLL